MWFDKCSTLCPCNLFVSHFRWCPYVLAHYENCDATIRLQGSDPTSIYEYQQSELLCLSSLTISLKIDTDVQLQMCTTNNIYSEHCIINCCGFFIQHYILNRCACIIYVNLYWKKLVIETTLLSTIDVDGSLQNYIINNHIQQFIINSSE